MTTHACKHIPLRCTHKTLTHTHMLTGTGAPWRTLLNAETDSEKQDCLLLILLRKSIVQTFSAAVMNVSARASSLPGTSQGIKFCEVQKMMSAIFRASILEYVVETTIQDCCYLLVLQPSSFHHSDSTHSTNAFGVVLVLILLISPSTSMMDAIIKLYYADLLNVD